MISHPHARTKQQRGPQNRQLARKLVVRWALTWGVTTVGTRTRGAADREVHPGMKTAPRIPASGYALVMA